MAKDQGPADREYGTTTSPIRLRWLVATYGWARVMRLGLLGKILGLRWTWGRMNTWVADILLRRTVRLLQSSR